MLVVHSDGFFCRESLRNTQKELQSKILPCEFVKSVVFGLVVLMGHRNYFAIPPAHEVGPKAALKSPEVGKLKSIQASKLKHQEVKI